MQMFRKKAFRNQIVASLTKERGEDSAIFVAPLILALGQLPWVFFILSAQGDGRTGFNSFLEALCACLLLIAILGALFSAVTAQRYGWMLQLMIIFYLWFFTAIDIDEHKEVRGIDVFAIFIATQLALLLQLYSKKLSDRDKELIKTREKVLAAEMIKRTIHWFLLPLPLFLGTEIVYQEFGRTYITFLSYLLLFFYYLAVIYNYHKRKDFLKR